MDRDNNLPPVYLVYSGWFKEPYLSARIVDEDTERPEFDLTTAEMNAIDKASELVEV